MELDENLEVRSVYRMGGSAGSALWSGSALASGSGSYNTSTGFDTFTSSCVTEAIHGSVDLPYPRILLNTVRILQSIFLLFLSVFGSFLNLFVIVLVAKFKKLQTMSFIIAIPIVASNFVLTLVAGLIGLINCVANRWLLGKHLCSLVGSVIFICITVRESAMLAFVLDRFLSVFLPFSYPKHQLRSTVAFFIAPCLYAVVMGILGYVLDCYSFQPRAWVCILDASCNMKCTMLLSIYGVLTFLFIRILPVILYALLFMKGRQARKSIADVSRGVESVATEGHNKYDWKATITFFLLFLTVLVLSQPSIIIFLVVQLVYPEKDSRPFAAHVLTVFANCTINLLRIMDPIVIMRNRDVREILGKIKQRHSR